jgi:hypothetical protein
VTMAAAPSSLNSSSNISNLFSSSPELPDSPIRNARDRRRQPLFW